MDNNVYTNQTVQKSEKKSMYLTIITWSAIVIAIAFIFTAIMMVKAQLSDNKQAIYENSQKIQLLQDCIDSGTKPCTIESIKD